MKTLFKAILMVLVLLAGQAMAATCTSIASGNWNSTSTWNCTSGSTPASTDSVILASSYTVSLNGSNRTAASLTINSGATLDDDGRDLSVNGNVVNNGTFGTNGGAMIMRGTNSTLSGTGVFSDTDVQTDATGISIPVGSTMRFTNGAELRVGRDNPGSFTLNGTINGTGLASGARIIRVYDGSSATINGTVNAPSAYIRVEQNASLTNNGSVTVQYLDSDGNNPSSVWTQGANSSLTLSQTPANAWRGTFNASANNNTVTYTADVTPLTPSSNTYYNIGHPRCAAVSGFIILGSSPCVTAAPTATTGAASSVTATGATLNGVVSSNGASTTVTFDYGLATNTYTLSATAAQSPLGAGASGTAVSAAVTGLSCNTTYYFRAKGVSTGGTTNGSELNFKTSACPAPTVTAISPTSGPTGGGTPVTITGNGFNSTATASIGGSTCTVTGTTTATTLTCTTTAHAAGIVNVVVTNPDTQSGTLTNGYTYVAALPASCNTGTISGVINTYHQVTSNLAIGATSITVGASTGSATALAANDLVLIMQMQDATINTSNTSAYGANDGSGSGATAIAAGKYEYATVSSVAGATVTLSSGLTNSYTYQAGSGVVAQKTIQLIRIPVFSSGTLTSSATALAWNGSTGGVLAFDVTGALNLNGATVDVSGKGFRGGGGRQLTGGSGTSADYRTLATNNANGSKGEGIAGTPRYLDNAGALLDTSVEGYPSGSYAKGAPANAGGGGTDNNPSANDQNTGGGGGANGGAGGMGGYGWSAPASPGRGIGGAAVSSSAGQLALGGGGGAATTNNGTGSPGSGFASSGAAGGGIVMIRAGSLSGTGTINVNGANANNTVLNDGSGGGGAAGSVMVSASSGLNLLTVTANGGTGGTNTGGGADHGPGGGGGGGYFIGSGALAACNVNGGGNGTTYLSHPFGATAGGSGLCTTSASLAASIPGAALGAGPCAPTLAHYAISYPLGNPGVTCEALAVRITGHDTTHAAVAPTVGTQITLSTSPVADGWALRSGGGTFAAPNFNFKYTFDGTETFAEFWLTKTTPTTAPHININVTDGSKTDVNGDATEDEKAQFTDTAFKYYDGPSPGGVEVSINNQIAGKSSNVAPNAQTLYLRAVKKSTTTGACVGGLAGAQNVEFAYECNNPATCYGSDRMNINVVANTPITGNNNGAVTDVSGGYTSVGMTFDASGYASFNLNYSDAGQVTLHARKTVTARVGPPPSTAATIYGASNAFIVKPYSFEIANIIRNSDNGANPGAGNASGTAFMAAGNSFSATVSAMSYTTGTITPSFGRESVPEGVSLTHNLVSPSGGANGNLGGTTTIPGASFQGATKGVATVTDLSWDEVGIITLKASNENYLGVGNDPLDQLGACTLRTTGETCQGTFGDSGNVGRFYPHHFDLSVGTIIPADPSGFSYMDQSFGISFTLTAKNLTGGPTGTTANYTTAIIPANNFAKLNPATASWLYTGLNTNSSFGLGAKQGSTDLSSRLALSGTPSGTWTGGGAPITTNLTFGRPSTTTPDASWGPYETLDIGVAPQDADGVKILQSVLNLDADSSGTTERIKMSNTTKLRFGRLHLLNSYGSQLLPMRVDARAEYWDGSKWLLNSNDSTTTIPAAGMATGSGGISGNTCFLTNPRPAAPTNASCQLSGSPAVTLSAGAGSWFVFDRTTPQVGFADLEINLAAMPWLLGHWSGAATGYTENPVARIKFGSPKAPYIYLRERY